MRADDLVVLTKAEFDALERLADAGAAAGEMFNVEEMQAIREQYEARVTVAEERREELEWKLRMELAKIRDAELSARRAADEMRQIEQALLSILEESDDTQVQVRSVVPSAGLHPVAPRPQASITSKKPVPPPIPAAPAGSPRNGNGSSHAETFRAAMANRKRYVA